MIIWHSEDGSYLLNAVLEWKRGNSLKEKIKFVLAFMSILLFLPYISVMVLKNNVQAEDVFFSGNNTEIKQENGVEELVVGILAAQIPVEYELETIKAQAVIARTESYKQMEQQEIENLQEENLSQYMSVNQMEEAWGYQKFQEYYKKLKSAVEETKGVTMKYQDNYIEPSFHAISSGYSREGNEVYHSENYSYLKAVENPYDMLADNYVKIIHMEKQELTDKINKELNSEISPEDIMKKIEITGRDKGDYVASIKIGEHTMAGEEFRHLLNLNSACFYMEETEGKIRITTKGLGHGIGLSQYNANELAKDGKNYQEILQYYFSDIEFVSE